MADKLLSMTLEKVLDVAWSEGPCDASLKLGQGRSDCCPAVVDPYTWLALVAGIALATYFLRVVIVVKAPTGRKKRDMGESYEDEDYEKLQIDGVYSGLEEFEEKMDKLGEGVEDEEDQESWITKLYNDFKHVKDEVDAEEKLSENDLDGLEPPILDATWGLGAVRNNFEGEKSSKTADISSNEIDSSRGKRSVEDEFVKDVDNAVDIADTVEGGEKCRLLVWRCMSRVMEGGLGYIEKPGGLMGLAQKTLFKIAFHGGFSNIWKSIMTIPEARSVKRCMNEHDECISYEILAAEASTGNNDDDKDIIREKKKKRMIINSEFVAGMDTSDGANQYDDDVLIDEDM